MKTNMRTDNISRHGATDGKKLYGPVAAKRCGVKRGFSRFFLCCVELREMTAVVMLMRSSRKEKSTEIL